ncbi:hypothetical protein TBR22_A34510 [Luteitalea sp. TBR-22]|nr:hypothetical protein TBR22_A34510 [Luteitalea sp. TBR-22]
MIAYGRVKKMVGGLAPGVANASFRTRFHSMTIVVVEDAPWAVAGRGATAAPKASIPTQARPTDA